MSDFESYGEQLFLPPGRRAILVFMGSQISSFLFTQLTPIRVLSLVGLLLAGLLGSVNGEPPVVDLTTEELDWLALHPTVRIAPDADFAPFEMLDGKGRYSGLTADYMNLIGERLGIQFEIVKTADRLTMAEMLREQEIDVLPAAAESPQRKRLLLFTEPYISVPGVIISSKTYGRLSDLQNSKVAVVTGFVWDDLLTHNQVDVRLVRVEDTLTGLELAAMGAVDAMLGDLATTTNYIRVGGITNLRIVTRLERNLELSIAVRNDWPELHSIFNKAIESITKEEHENIRSKWLKLDTPSLLKNRTFWYVTLSSFGFFILVLSGIVFWNRSLKKQVAIRTEALRDAQMKLIRAEKMESIGRLAAGVAHEVKNPLAIIQMGADFLSQDSEKDEATRTVIKEIEDAVKRADSVIRGLLDFSRDRKFETQPGAVNDVLDRSLQLVNHEMRNRNIEVNLSLGDDLPEIEMDANKLQQVFVNLMMNAAQAMPNGGTLTLKSYVFTISDKAMLKRDSSGEFRMGETALGVEFLDTGPGIRSEDLEQLFDPFFSTKPVGEGTGLGLSVSRNIVHLHRGFIDIRNRDSGGVSVLIILKLARGEK